MYLLMNVLGDPVPIEGAQELPNSLKKNWQEPVYMGSIKSGFIHLNLMPNLVDVDFRAMSRNK